MCDDESRDSDNGITSALNENGFDFVSQNSVDAHINESSDSDNDIESAHNPNGFNYVSQSSLDASVSAHINESSGSDNGISNVNHQNSVDANDTMHGDEFEFISGLRANSNLLYIPSEKQAFYFNATIKNGASYKCRVSKCNVRVVYTHDHKVIRNEGDKHNHSIDEQFIKQAEFRSHLRNTCISMPVERKKSARAVYTECKEK